MHISSDRHFQQKNRSFKRRWPARFLDEFVQKIIFAKYLFIRRWTRQIDWKVKAIAVHTGRVALNHRIIGNMELSSIAYIKALKQEIRHAIYGDIDLAIVRHSFKLNNFDVRVWLRFTRALQFAMYSIRIRLLFHSHLVLPCLVDKWNETYIIITSSNWILCDWRCLLSQ